MLLTCWSHCYYYHIIQSDTVIIPLKGPSVDDVIVWPSTDRQTDGRVDRRTEGRTRTTTDECEIDCGSLVDCVAAATRRRSRPKLLYCIIADTITTATTSIPRHGVRNVVLNVWKGIFLNVKPCFSTSKTFISLKSSRRIRCGRILTQGMGLRSVNVHCRPATILLNSRLLLKTGILDYNKSMF